MIISYNWLKKYLDTPLNIYQLAEILTDIGLEVESIKKKSEEFSYLKEVVSAEVLILRKHPDSDHLKIAQLDIGNSTYLEIICGAPNIAKGQKVLLAQVGAKLPSKEGVFEIKQAKIRGVLSFGMICSEAELGIGKDSQGILILDPSTPIGVNAFELFYGKEDFSIEIGITPNRSDAISHYGVARDLHVAIKAREIDTSQLVLPSIEAYEKEKGAGFLDLEVQIESQKCISYYASALFNVKVKPSPTWLKEALNSISVESINNVVDLTNFIMYETGQPLHAYDLDKIAGKKIIIKTLQSQDQEETIFKTLNKKEKTLCKEDLLICDKKSVLGLAGIMGGENSSIEDKSKNILIESACFDSISIRKSAKKHELNTEASFRFERGLDPDQNIYALKRALLLLKELTGGTISSNLIGNYPKIIENKKIELRYKKVFQVLGKIDKKKIREILELLEIKILFQTQESLKVEVPLYRVDVCREIDLIEEIARIYGYNQLPSANKIHFSAQTKKEFNEPNYKKIANQLIIQGFYENMNLSLTKKAYQEIAQNPKELIYMLNPISNDLFFLRNTPLFGLLEVVEYNINRKNQELKFFEKGKIYFKNNNKQVEEEFLAVLTSSKDEKKNSFFYLKGIIQQLLDLVSIEKFSQINSTYPFFSEGIELNCNGKNILKIGQIKQEIIAYFSIHQKVFYCEINWKVLNKNSSLKKQKFEPLNKYPVVKRDLALLLDEKITFEEIYQLIKSSEKKILKKVILFDTYQGRQLPEGKKSYALSFFLQNKEKTLTENHIEEIMQKIQNLLKEKLDIELR